MDLKIEFILIGDELLSGHKKDANLSQLTSILAMKGLKLSFIQVVGDNFADIENAFLLASDRSNVIITSGGLGPTKDDLTKEALSKAFELPLKFSDQAQEVANQHYERVGRTCNFDINQYDQLPAGCLALSNPVGFAPGIFYSNISKKFSFILAPGVPKEFKAMIEFHLEKKLSLWGDFKAKTQLQWKTFGIAEERIFSEIAPTLWDQLAKYGSVSSLPHLSGVDIGLTIDAENLKTHKPLIDKIIRESGLETYIWATENCTLAEHIVALAKRKKTHFSFVESCTGGLASHYITQVAGCSEVFKGSLITYQTEMKNSLLKIDSSTTGLDGVNEETVLLMGIAGKKITGSNFCVAFSGYAGPTGGTADNPVGRLWVSLTDKEGKQQSKKLDFIGNRADRIERFTYAGLHFLRQELEKLVE